MAVRTVPPTPRTLWVLPPTGSTSDAHVPFVDMFDGVLLLKAGMNIREGDVVFFDGGTDVDPKLYGEEPHVMTGKPDMERDKREKQAFIWAQQAGAKCFGVCRGAQFLCVMSGGKLIQHVSGHNGGHMIATDNGEALYSESSHHQMMWPNEIPHVLIAWADSKFQQPFKVSDEYAKTVEDGQFAEMIYCKDTRSLCIQGHSEWMEKDSAFVRLTRKLVREFLLQS